MIAEMERKKTAQEVAQSPMLRLVEGLPGERISRICKGWVADEGVGNRVLAFYLNDMHVRGAHQKLGHATAVQFAECQLEMSRRRARELIRTGAELHEVVKIDQAFHEQRISWTKTRLLTRVATPETESAWLELALKLTTRELAQEVRCGEKGRLPRKDRKGLPGVRFKITARVDAVTHEMWEQARRKIAARAGEELSEDAVVRSMAEMVLREPSDDAEARGRKLDDSLFRLVIDHDVVRGTVDLRTDAGPVPLEAGMAAALLCDAQLGSDERDQRLPGCTCTCHGKESLRLEHGKDRQTPDWMRKRILARDGFRCRSCGRGEGLHVHPNVYREDGGRTVPRNLVTTCDRCHALIHGGFLRASGKAPHGLRFLDREGRDVRNGVRLGRNASLQLVREGGARAPLGASERRTVGPADVPKEVSREWWRQHEHLFEWNGRRGLLDFSPGYPCEPEPEAGDEAPVEDGETQGGERPARLSDLVGLERIAGDLGTAVAAARKEERPVDHVFLQGPPGLGKTSLARALAAEMGRKAWITSGPALSDGLALLQILCGLSEGDVLFLDEVHALPKKVAEMLYEAMEDGKVSVPVVCGGRVRTITIGLARFTLVGATTDPDRMPAALVSRFRIQEHVEFYGEGALEEIVKRAAARAGIGLDERAAGVLARASAGTPRQALRVFARARDLVVARARQVIGLKEAREALEQAGLDAVGMGPLHRQAVELLAELGRPMGAGRLAARLGIPRSTFKRFYEPQLLRLGRVVAMPRGLAAAR